MPTKKRLAVFALGAILTFVTLTGQAVAMRADGVCGGVGTYDPATGQCV
jgi:hypothetical protein